MAAAYSYDLRLRVVKFLEAGNKLKDTAKLYCISRKTIIEWKKLKAKTGDVRAREGYQKGNRLIIRDMTSFKEFIDQNCDKTIKELAYIWEQKVSRSTIARAIHKLGYSYKKNFYSSQKGCWRKA